MLLKLSLNWITLILGVTFPYFSCSIKPLVAYLSIWRSSLYWLASAEKSLLILMLFQSLSMDIPTPHFLLPLRGEFLDCLPSLHPAKPGLAPTASCLLPQGTDCWMYKFVCLLLVSLPWLLQRLTLITLRDAQSISHGWECGGSWV